MVDNIDTGDIQRHLSCECLKNTHLGKNLHDVTEDLHSPVNGSIRS